MVIGVNFITGARAAERQQARSHQGFSIPRLNSGFYLWKRVRPANFPDARTHFRQSRARQC
jgi:hypothetical protein